MSRVTVLKPVPLGTQLSAPLELAAFVTKPFSFVVIKIFQYLLTFFSPDSFFYMKETSDLD